MRCSCDSWRSNQTASTKMYVFIIFWNELSNQMVLSHWFGLMCQEFLTTWRDAMKGMGLDTGAPSNIRGWMLSMLLLLDISVSTKFGLLAHVRKCTWLPSPEAMAVLVMAASQRSFSNWGLRRSICTIAVMMTQIETLERTKFQKFCKVHLDFIRSSEGRLSLNQVRSLVCLHN